MKTTTNSEQIRAWKDPEFKKSLSSEAQAQLAPNPAGERDVRDVKDSKDSKDLVAKDRDVIESARGRSPAPLMSNDTSGGTQCSAHGGCSGIELPEIVINPAPKAGSYVG